jgi:hypothetical protein
VVAPNAGHNPSWSEGRAGSWLRSVISPGGALDEFPLRCVILKAGAVAPALVRGSGIRAEENPSEHARPGLVEEWLDARADRWHRGQRGPGKGKKSGC